VSDGRRIIFADEIEQEVQRRNNQKTQMAAMRKTIFANFMPRF